MNARQCMCIINDQCDQGATCSRLSYNRRSSRVKKDIQLNEEERQLALGN